LAKAFSLLHGGRQGWKVPADHAICRLKFSLAAEADGEVLAAKVKSTGLAQTPGHL
jgi:hypothetical protein